MSVRIRVSYQTEPELWDVLSCLGPRVTKIKYAPAAGRYRRVYIEVRPETGIPATDIPNKRLTSAQKCGTMIPAK